MVVQAEEAAHKEARRLAEEEELREHRRKLQFKVHMISSMHLLSKSPATPNPVSCHPLSGFQWSKYTFYTTCAVLCVVVWLCMMIAGGRNSAGCTLLSAYDALQARPVPTYGAPFLPSLSGSKLTEAKSPAFCTRSRDR